ncbi:hypothetical protein F383_00549 [Gossypium arboreum]|uniref:Uncharacterized protein n=1 Tax=Gossypium arboreum TaxID=29729 RepID=A0A0B0PAA6_GOSAR|nr:hypothetical protein F383_20660 [Gossypium arboreum]KHG21209.1 hypothetical protein F383_00549 [Gossypium arboreum]
MQAFNPESLMEKFVCAES